MSSHTVCDALLNKLPTRSDYLNFTLETSDQSCNQMSSDNRNVFRRGTCTTSPSCCWFTGRVYRWWQLTWYYSTAAVTTWTILDDTSGAAVYIILHLNRVNNSGIENERCTYAIYTRGGGPGEGCSEAANTACIKSCPLSSRFFPSILFQSC